MSVANTDREFVPLCDDDGAGTVVPFLRRYSTDQAGAVTATDTDLDGTTPYTVAGTVTTCQAAPAVPVAVEVHAVQDTDWDLTAQAGTQSVTLLVFAGAVTVTTAEGALTVPAGSSLSWGVDGDQGDAELTGTLTIDGAAPGASWHVLWTSQ
ncbi:hypothetical protein [Streptomyces sp. NPDC007346]|uniref:hypothetical protein n=1 Tax=Streptomyces sp. NPDC007346 TaxID=3154682 RepID=UPI003452F65D